MSPLEPDQNNPSYNTALGANEPTEHAKGPSNETERWLHTVVDNASDMVTVLDADRIIRYVSPAVERLLGYRPEELVGTLAFDYVHPEDIEFLSSSFAEALENPGLMPPIEFRLLAKDGSWRYVEMIRNNQLGDPAVKGMVTTTRDITERKEAEERFRSLVQNASDVILIMGADQTVRYISPAVERVLGYKPEEVMGKDNFGVVHPDDMDRVGESVAEAVRNPGTTFSMELRLRHADGSWRHVKTNCTSLLDDPAVGGIVFNTRDITERVRAEDELHALQREYEELVDSVDAIIWKGKARPLRFTFVSHQAETVLGYPVERWLTEPSFWSDHIHPEDREWAVSFCTKAIEEKRSHTFEYRMIGAGGEVVWLRDIVHVAVEGGVPTQLFGVMIDVTERKRAEEALKESEERFRTVFEDAPIGVALVALDGRRFRANRALCQMLGCSEEDLLEDYLVHDQATSWGIDR